MCYGVNEQLAHQEKLLEFQYKLRQARCEGIIGKTKVRKSQGNLWKYSEYQCDWHIGSHSEG